MNRQELGEVFTTAALRLKDNPNSNLNEQIRFVALERGLSLNATSARQKPVTEDELEQVKTGLDNAKRMLSQARKAPKEVPMSAERQAAEYNRQYGRPDDTASVRMTAPPMVADVADYNKRFGQPDPGAPTVQRFSGEPTASEIDAYNRDNRLGVK